jgi:hypothetical protein
MDHRFASTPAKERFKPTDHRVASLESPLLQPLAAPKQRSLSEESNASGFSDILLRSSRNDPGYGRSKSKDGSFPCFYFIQDPFSFCRVLIIAVPLVGFLLSNQLNYLSNKHTKVSLGTLWGAGLSTICLFYVM